MTTDPHDVIHASAKRCGPGILTEPHLASWVEGGLAEGQNNQRKKPGPGFRPSKTGCRNIGVSPSKTDCRGHESAPPLGCKRSRGQPLQGLQTKHGQLMAPGPFIGTTGKCGLKPPIRRQAPCEGQRQRQDHRSG